MKMNFYKIQAKMIDIKISRISDVAAFLMLECLE